MYKLTPKQVQELLSSAGISAQIFVDLSSDEIILQNSVGSVHAKAFFDKKGNMKCIEKINGRFELDE